MQEINIGGTRMLAALEWDAIAGIKKSQEIKESAKNSGKNYAVVVEGVEAVGVGFAEKPSKLPSAAAWLSQAYETKNSDFILVERLDDGSYWICAIRKGVPVLGYDAITDFDGAVSRVTDLVSFGGFVVFSLDASLAQTFGGVPEVLSEGFVSLTQGKPCKTKIKKVAGLPVLAISASVLVIGMMVSWFAYESYEADRILNERRQAAAAKKDAAAAAIIAGNNAAVKQWYVDYEKAKAREIEKIVKALSRNEDDLMSKWYSAVISQRVDVPGWDLASAKCDAVQCDFVYDSGRAGGNNFALMNAVSSTGKVSFRGESFGRAKFIHKLPEITSVPSTVNDIPPENEFFGQVVSEVQELSSFGIKIEVQNVAEVNFVPPPPPKIDGNAKELLPKDIATPNKSTGMMRGTMMIKGEGTQPMLALANALKRGKGMVLTDLRTPIDLVSPQQWKIEGVFYIKKGN